MLITKEYLNFSSESLKTKMSPGVSTSPSRGAPLLQWCSFLAFLLKGKQEASGKDAQFSSQIVFQKLCLSQGDYTE